MFTICLSTLFALYSYFQLLAGYLSSLSFFAYLATISLLSRLYRRDIWISLHISSCLNKQQYKIIQIPVYIRISMYILFLWDSVVFWWITNDFIQASLGEQFSSLLSISNALQVKNIKSQNFLKVVMKAKLQQLWDNKLLLLQFWSKFTSNHNHNKMVTPLGKRSLLDQ